MTNVVWTKELVMERLLAKDENVWAGTVMLYRRQTAAEQEHGRSTQKIGSMQGNWHE